MTFCGISSGSGMAGVGATLGLMLLVNGCGSFAFYEDTKVGINIKVDPKAPEPVEISASFKEAVFALVPARRPEGGGEVHVGAVLSDFDVRYGLDAGGSPSWGRDWLYAVITHGVATGAAATALVAKGPSTAEAGRRAALARDLRALTDAELAAVLRRLGIDGLRAEDAVHLRGRLDAALAVADGMDLVALERALGAP